MSWTRPGRLRRTLDRIGVPSPLLSIAGDSFAVADDQITSVSIAHGGTEPSPGITPSTCETVIQRPSWIKTGEGLSVKLTSAAATAIAGRTNTPAATIRDRFNGRVGRQTNTDTPRRLSARMAAASWSAQLSRIDTTLWINAGTAISDAIRLLVTPAAIPQITWASYGTFDTLAVDLTEATTDDLDTLTAELGVLVRDTRAGVLEAWALPYRKSWADARLADRHPLTRSQAISPATWEQPNEDMPAKVRADWIGSDGTAVARSAGGTETSTVERHDWTHVRDRTGALDMRFEALYLQQWDRIFRIPSVTVDLLYLLSSDKTYHRQQAGMLLALNAGDTIGLAGDWYTDLQGIHIVSGIDESITGSEWTLTLSLVPHLLVFGSESPPVPAIVWGSAVYPWRDESRTWALN